VSPSSSDCFPISHINLDDDLNADKLSDVAAKASNGRPTYCDSRYYRAVAGGGQGCD
jgi:hypothetical protein